MYIYIYYILYIYYIIYILYYIYILYSIYYILYIILYIIYIFIYYISHITFIFSEESVFLDLSQAKYSALERTCANGWIPGATCANGVPPHIASFSPLAYPEPQHLASQALHQSLCRNPCIPLVLQELDWKPWQIGCVGPVGGKQQAASIMGELLKTSCGFSGLGSGAACSFSY